MARGALLLARISVVFPILAFLALSVPFLQENDLLAVLPGCTILALLVPLAALRMARKAGTNLEGRGLPIPADCASARRTAILGILLSLLSASATAMLGPGLETARVSSNETAAIAGLRNLAVRQSQVQDSGAIDVDQDGVGEFATIQELTGAAGVRASADGSRRGQAISPLIPGSSWAIVDASGAAIHNGYAFRVSLPDSGPTGWVHETGPAATPGLAGGTGSVGIDTSEATWCACAWPLERGVSGWRCFFVDQAGDVLQSANEVAKWSGTERTPMPRPRAGRMGEAGSSAPGGETWRPVN